MASIRYNLTKFMFKHLVRPMMKKAAKDPERFMEQQRKKRESKPLPLGKLHKGYEFEEDEEGGTPYYVFRGVDGADFRDTEDAEENSGGDRKRKLIFYFFGGGFVMPGNEGDFKFAQEMSERTGADVWLVWHKLLPDVDGKGLLESVLCVYREALKRYEAKNITLFGLSSGGSLCLDLCVYISENNPDIPLPGQLVPVSATIGMPPTENQYEQMKKIEGKDAMFTAGYVKAAVKMMLLCGADGLLGNSAGHSWKGFPRIMAFYGTDEIYYAQLDAFKQKCAEDGVELSTFTGEGMMHTWLAAGWLPEAEEARNALYKYISRN